MGGIRCVGISAEYHPLALWKDKLAAFKRIKAVWLPRYVGERKTYRLADHSKRDMDQGRVHVLFEF
jgi:hypothetical protein